MLKKFLNFLAMLFVDQERVRGFEPVIGAPEDTKLPVRGSDGSAGYDLYAPMNIYVPARGCSDLIPLNVKAYMQPGEYLAITIRSSLAVKEKYGHLHVIQGNATIDQDFYGNPTNDGNIGVMFCNNSDHDVVILKGDRCCQGIFMNYLLADNDISLGDRKGGYGSTENDESYYSLRTGGDGRHTDRSHGCRD